MPKLVRITTIPASMQVLLKGQMKFMQQHGFEVTMISGYGPEIKALEQQEGCPHMIVPFTRKITPLKDLVCLINLIKIFKKLKPDIVHTHTPKAGLLGMWGAWIAGVPVRLHTIAGLPWVETKGMLRFLLRMMEKLTAMPASRIYPNSNTQKNFLKEQKIGGSKMKLLGKGSSNGINTQYFSLNENIAAASKKIMAAENIKPDTWIWIFIGRLVKDKGIGELLDGFQTIHQQFPGDRLWLLGNEEPELDPLDAHHYKILHEHPAIRSFGFQHDVRPYLAASEVLVFPSYREGFPNVPLQAGAMGCMLLLSNINGCNEIVENDINGILVPPKDAVALTKAMLHTRNAPERKEEFASATIKKIKRDYDQQNLWQILLKEYNELLITKN